MPTIQQADLRDRIAKLKAGRSARALSREEDLAANRLEEKYERLVQRAHDDNRQGATDSDEYEQVLADLEFDLRQEEKRLGLPSGSASVSFKPKAYGRSIRELEAAGDYRTAQRLRELKAKD